MIDSGKHPKAPALPSIEPKALRIVLFGMPDAGKSSLLGALAQSAQTQERQLMGRLIDTWQGLAELQRRVYDEKPHETLEEIVPYPATFDPFRGAKPDQDKRLQLVLFDCDGRAANEILTHRGDLEDVKSEKLANAILNADALLLVVDASATHEQFEADFAEFTRFLHLLEKNREHRSEIGGLPVYLVLSKCDLLAQPQDSRSDWANRVEERRTQVEARFKEFLEEDEEKSPLGFGSVDLTVTATAVLRPALQGSAAAPRDPFGVADLFRQAIHSADDYRARLGRSHRRLLITVAVAVAFVLLLVSGAIGLILTREQFQSVPLAGAVENYRSRENPTPSARLTEPLQRKISELSDIRRNPDFERLPPDLQDFVSNRLRELSAYQEYKARLERERPPSEMRTPEELNRLESRLRDSLGPPSEYQNEWTRTDAELLRQKWLGDISAIRNAVAETSEWHSKNAEAADNLEQFKDRPGMILPWGEWNERVQNLLETAGKPLHPESELLRGSEPLPSMKAPAVTFATVQAFQTVQLAREYSDKAKKKLTRLRDIATALGLVGNGSSGQAPLKIPDAFRVDQAAHRLQLLKTTFPDYGDWSPVDVSEAAAPEVRGAARISYDRLIDAGRQIVLRELKKACPDGQETQERWKAVLGALSQSPELREWSRLVKTEKSLAGMPLDDPVAELNAFVQRPNFSLKFGTVRVSIPDDIYESRIRPSGKLSIVHRSGSTRNEITFQLGDNELRDNRRRITTFLFAVDRDATLTYTPGDELYAALPVRDAANKEWKFTWLQCRSDLYRFESLHRIPRFHERDDPSPTKTGKLVEVHMTFTPESGAPLVPDLMPTVILKP